MDEKLCPLEVIAKVKNPPFRTFAITSLGPLRPFRPFLSCNYCWEFVILLPSTMNFLLRSGFDGGFS
jgi:hypothetical protein